MEKLLQQAMACDRVFMSPPVAIVCADHFAKFSHVEILQQATVVYRFSWSLSTFSAGSYDKRYVPNLSAEMEYFVWQTLLPACESRYRLEQVTVRSQNNCE